LSFDAISISEWVSIYIVPAQQNAFVETFGNEKIWLTWTKQIGKDGKPTKVPTKMKEGQRVYVNATDAAQLATHDEVMPHSANVAKLGLDGVGGLGTSTRHISNIEMVDLDHCVHNGVITNPLIRALVDAADTYTEFSPSGTGLHLAFDVSDGKPELGFKKFVQDAARDDVQIQTNCTYYTFTGKAFRDRPVRTVTRKELADLYALVGMKEAPPPLAVPARQNEPRVSPLLDDRKLLEKAFASKNGDKIKALYDGDLSTHKNDNSVADLALCSSLAFWTVKDPERMDRIFRASKLMRLKWDEKRGNTTYGRMTITKAIEGCRDVYTGTDSSLAPIDENFGYLMSGGKDPKPLLVLENICRVLERDGTFRGALRLNDFSSMTETHDKQSGEWRLLSDEFIFDAIRHVSATYPSFVKVSKDMMTNAMLAVAGNNKVNPPKDYLLSLKWDGVSRLDSWLYHTYGTPDDKIHREIGANWMKGLVLRIMRPGCQYDHVIVLEARQGWKKSSSLRVLGEPWHVEITVSPDDKDFLMILAQNAIVEFSEGDIVSRTDVKKLKGIITKVQDQVRLPYARGVSILKRGCVFAMTTNDTDYLKDETGNRRWLPVKLGKIADVEWIRTNRDQLYAEAYHRAITLGETSYEYSDEEQLKGMQESRRERNDYEEDVVLWYLRLPQERRDLGIQAKDVYNEVISPGAGAKDFAREIPRQTQWQIIGMLKGALSLESKDVKREGVVLKRWLPTEETVKKLSLKKRDAYGRLGPDRLW
jgi:hypothetical protein